MATRVDDVIAIVGRAWCVAHGLLALPAMSELSSSATPMRACQGCHQMWAEAMLAEVRGQWLCPLCKERGVDSSRSSQRHGGSSFLADADRIRTFAVIFTVLAIAGIVGFRLFLRSAIRGPAPAIQESESWAKEEPAKWPAIFLANEAKFSETKIQTASNAFLIEGANGTVLGAAFLVGAQRPAAADDEAPALEFSEWNMAAPDSPPVRMKQLFPAARTALDQGIALLSVDAPPAKWPVMPLKLRRDGYGENNRMKVAAANGLNGAIKAYPVIVRSNASADDEVTVAISVNGRTGRQRVIRVSGSGSASVFELEAPVRLGDVLGAPIIDAFGHLAAIVTGADTGPDPQASARAKREYQEKLAAAGEIPPDPEAQVKRLRAFGMDALKKAAGIDGR